MSPLSRISCSDGHSYERSEGKPGEYERVCIRVSPKKQSLIRGLARHLGDTQSSICVFLMMYVFTKVRADMKTSAKVRHNAPIATSQFWDEGECAKSGC